ncbi:MAG: hypothetical protein ACC726_12440 [Chloroflexota bacterium]
MNKRSFASAPLVAALALSGIAAGATAQEPADSAGDSASVSSTTGTVVAVEDGDGLTGYFLQLEDGTLVELSFGPSWFWGELNPFAALVDSVVTVGGQLRDGRPGENASGTAKEQAAKDPVVKVRTIDGSRRDKGKPPWAGGPKVVGEVHPGYGGWSKGQANKAAKPEKAVKPDKPAKASKPAKAASPAGGKPTR